MGRGPKSNSGKDDVLLFEQMQHSACRAGWSASELDSALSPEDFVCGKSLFPIAAASGTWQVHAEIFGHWVSTVYITLAQVGSAHPPDLALLHIDNL